MILKVTNFWNSTYFQVVKCDDGAYYKRQRTVNSVWGNWSHVPRGTYIPFRDLKTDLRHPDTIEVQDE